MIQLTNKDIQLVSGGAATLFDTLFDSRCDAHEELLIAFGVASGFSIAEEFSPYSILSFYGMGEAVGLGLMGGLISLGVYRIGTFLTRTA